MSVNKDSQIVQIFSAELAGREMGKGEQKDAHDLIKELASNPNPNNVYEIAQIMSYVIDDGLTQRTQYIEQIADVKRTDIGARAQFQIELDELVAMFQAKSSTTERSKVSNKFFTLDTEEVSVRPIVNFYDLVTGKTNLVRLAGQAAAKMDNAIVRRIQDSVYAAFSAMSTPNYASGAGLVPTAFDPILFAMNRVGGGATITGDMEALAEFTEVSGFNNTVADALAVEHNQNGMIGSYKGARLLKMDNPYKANSITETELRKDLIYVVPSGDTELRPIKVQFEGGVHAINPDQSIDSKAVEFRFDQYVGTAAVGVRKLLGVYENTSL